jgi:hypothetical protein
LAEIFEFCGVFPNMIEDREGGLIPFLNPSGNPQLLDSTRV